MKISESIVNAEPPAFSVDDKNRFVFNPTQAFARKLLKIFKTHNPAVTKADLEGIVNRMFEHILIVRAEKNDVSDPATLTMAARVLQKLLTEKKRQEKYIHSFYKELGF